MSAHPSKSDVRSLLEAHLTEDLNGGPLDPDDQESHQRMAAYLLRHLTEIDASKRTRLADALGDLEAAAARVREAAR